MSKRKRILIWIGSLAGVVVLYLCFFGPQTLFALLAWNTGRKIPQVNAVPVELTDASVNQSQSTQFSQAGYEFELPWRDVDEVKNKIGGCLISFKSGIRIIFTTDPARAFVNNVASKSGGEESLRKNFGDAAISSDYNFYHLMLMTTPSSVSPLSSREAAMRGWVLLTLKAIAMPDPGNSGVYSFHTASFQGFQYGTPGNAARIVMSDLLDDNGNAEFVFGDVPGQPPQVTQADINRVTRSLRRIAAVTVVDTDSARTPNVASAP